jgi:Protein of unknown function (DUF742)
MTDDSTPHWYDDDAGPMVRLYAVTAGRARSAGATFDLMTVVRSNPISRPSPTMSPEQSRLLTICRYQAQTVADIVAESGLPLGVVRVLLGDLLEAGHVHVTVPTRRTPSLSRHILKEVIDGLRAL